MSDTPTTPARPAVGQVRTADEHADLLTYHLSQIRTERRAVEAAKAPVKAAKELLTEAQDLLTKRFNEAKVDLGRGYSREYLESLIKDGDTKPAALIAFENQRARDKPLIGQPVFGIQPELFTGAETPTATRDEFQWEAEGYLRGLRGDLHELQDRDPPTFHQAIMRGFERGQVEARERFARAMEAKAKAGQPDPEQKPVDLNEPEPGTPEAKAKERKAVERAKASLGVAANKVPA